MNGKNWNSLCILKIRGIIYQLPVKGIKSSLNKQIQSYRQGIKKKEHVMIYRSMLWGYYKHKNVAIADNIYFSAIKYYEDKVFIYIESEEDADTKQFITGDFELFPDKERLKEMSMIFAYSPSDNKEVWGRKQEKNSIFEIAYLREECVAKYVFYHYKMQGESCESYDRYGSIFLYGNILIMYLETPRESGERWERVLPENNLPNYCGNIIADCATADESGEFWRVM